MSDDERDDGRVTSVHGQHAGAPDDEAPGGAARTGTLDVTRYEARRRVRGAVARVLLLGLFSLLIVAFYPSIAAAGTDFESYVQNLPPAGQEGFGVSAITTVEGFLSTELYQFVWVLLLGLYMAYSAGGLVAGDVETGRLDLVLATPISRSRLLAEKFLALLVPVALANLVLPLFVFGGVLAVGESLPVERLVAVHALSVPYLLACAGVGLLLSVAVDRADAAQRGAIAAVFLLFLLDTVAAGSDYEWVGAVSPTRYFDPTQVLVEGTYDWGGALVLVAATLAALLASAVVFERRDV